MQFLQYKEGKLWKNNLIFWEKYFLKMRLSSLIGYYINRSLDC